MVFDFFWTYSRDRVWYLPESSIISGLILALVGAPSPDFALLVLMPAVAVFSKQLLWFGLGKHIFNPAAFSLVALSLAGYPAVSWWGVSWGAPATYAVLAAGLLILWRQRRWETALPFLFIYALLFGVRLLDGTTLFFATVMLIEPLTSNFKGIQNQLFYAGIAVLGTFFLGKTGWAIDPLLGGLLIANIVTSLLTIKIIKKQ